MSLLKTRALTFVYPPQLFRNYPAIVERGEVWLIEDPLLGVGSLEDQSSAGNNESIAFLK